MKNEKCNNCRTGPLAFPKWLCFALIGLTMTLLGCVAPYMVTSLNSQSGNYSVQNLLQGSFKLYGYPLDEGRKLLIVEVISEDPARPGKFSKKFHIHGSDVQWHDIWDDHDNLSLILYDYGPNVGSSIRRKPGAQMRYLGTVKFDSSSGMLTKVNERKPGTFVDWTNNVLIWGK